MKSKKEIYECHLNGKFYGKGDLDYMRELITDYMVTHDMYGHKEVNFKIIKKEKRVD